MQQHNTKDICKTLLFLTFFPPIHFICDGNVDRANLGQVYNKYNCSEFMNARLCPVQKILLLHIPPFSGSYIPPALLLSCFLGLDEDGVAVPFSKYSTTTYNTEL